MRNRVAISETGITAILQMGRKKQEDVGGNKTTTEAK